MKDAGVIDERCILIAIDVSLVKAIAAHSIESPD
jgi:hypothetical protein